MDRNESKGELIVEADMEALREAAKIVFGASIKEYVEDGKTIFTFETPLCPPRIIVEEIKPRRYHITSQSKCSIKDCPYWERCARIDSERLRTYEIALKRILGERVLIESKYKWLPERVREEEIEKVIDKIIRKK
ncbi:MAG: hypothetical protein QXX09_03580 [Candidatus Methanomethylicia archaeon]